MTELTWLIFSLWLIFVIWGLSSKIAMAKGTGAIIGFFFGFYIMNELIWLTFIILIFNIYVLYSAMFGDEGK